MTNGRKGPGAIERDTWGQLIDFKFRSYGYRQPFIMVQRLEGLSLPCLGDGWIGFELRDGLTDSESNELLGMMRSRIRGMTYNGPIQPGWRPGRRAASEAPAKWAGSGRGGNVLFFPVRNR
jgi:hypothetical protein